MPDRRLSPSHLEFRAARDLLLQHADDPQRAYELFRWPRPEFFNWALDWFDVIAAGNEATALQVVRPDGVRTASFAELSRRSTQAAGWLGKLGVQAGDRVPVVMDTSVEVWELLLALMKIRAVAVPIFTVLSDAEIFDRLRRCRANHLIASADQAPRLAEQSVPGTRVVVGGELAGWSCYAESADLDIDFEIDIESTRADELMSCYFTSGSTARPKMVAHNHVSYPIGHLSGMYWAGFRPGDVHLNISSPGWAKHPWGSFFAPWNAEATIVSIDTREASPDFVLDALERTGATTFCAPPGVWRAMAKRGLAGRRIALREAMSVGEPLTQDIVDAVRAAWQLTVRNGYGQSEVTAMAGVTPTSTDDPRSLGRPLPGYRVVLCPVGSEQPAEQGEFCLDLSDWPAGMMHGYLDDDGRRLEPAPSALALYRTGDLARRDADGSLHFIGRIKDVFSTPAGRLVAPAALEAGLVAHPAVAEAAVVTLPADPARGGQPIAKAFVIPAAGWNAGPVTAQALLELLADGGTVPVVLEFVDELPRTESGKIHREILRGLLRSPLAEFSVPAPAGSPEDSHG